MQPTHQPPWAARFWSKVIKNEATGCLEWTASLRNGYGQFRIDHQRSMPSAHRVAWELAHGAIPGGLVIDHLCHNRRCVNVDHLRLATVKQNADNVAGLHARNASGYRGVSFHRLRQKWRGTVAHFGKHIHLGLFETAEEASAAVEMKIAEIRSPIPEIR